MWVGMVPPNVEARSNMQLRALGRVCWQRKQETQLLERVASGMPPFPQSVGDAVGTETIDTMTPLPGVYAVGGRDAERRRGRGGA